MIFISQLMIIVQIIGISVSPSVDCGNGNTVFF